MLVTPCSPDELYVALMGPEDDRRASAVPVDTARWAELFPRHQDLLSRIDPGRATHHTNAHVKVRGWTSGRACILGDAAHGQPPNLGQGAGLALSNAVELAACLDSAATVEEGLASWEARWMPVATMVQQWSYWYGVLAYRWPAPLRRARLGALHALTKFGPTAADTRGYGKEASTTPARCQSRSGSPGAASSRPLLLVDPMDDNRICGPVVDRCNPGWAQPRAGGSRTGSRG